MSNDEFDLLLERCRERLSEIDLRVPALETGAPPQPVYSLTPAAPPTPVEREEEEFFPPLQARSRTPPPAIALPNPPLDPAPGRAPEPEPEPAAELEPKDRRLTATRAAAASAAVAAGILGVWLSRRPSADLDIEAAGAEALAVRQDKGDMLIAEGSELVDLSLDGRALGRRPLDAPVESLHWDRGSLWSADGRTASVIERTDAGHATVFTLNHVPGALYVKDNYLWTTEKGGHALHQFQITRSILGTILQPIDSFELGGLTPETFTIDDAGTLWVVDEPSRRLYRLHLENGTYQRSASAPLSPFVGPAGKIRGLSAQDGAVWMLAQDGSGGRASLRRIALSRLDWTP